MAIASALGWRGLSVDTLALTMRVSAGPCGCKAAAQPPSMGSPARAALSFRNSRREPISHLLVFRLELEARGLGLHEDERGEILFRHAVADHLLQQVARKGSERHGYLEFPAGVEP